MILDYIRSSTLKYTKSTLRSHISLLSFASPHREDVDIYPQNPLWLKRYGVINVGF